jgi:hypothetical protein
MASKFSDDSKYKFRLSEMSSESRIILPSIQDFEREPFVTLEKAIEKIIFHYMNHLLLDFIH